MGGECLPVLCIYKAVRAVLSDAVYTEEMAAGEAEEVVWLGVGVGGAGGEGALQRGPGFHAETDIAISKPTKSSYPHFPAANSI
jgi:hypothetical protein